MIPSASRHLFQRLGAWVASLLVLALPASRGSGTVTNCTEADLRAALRGGGQVALACNGTITLTSSLLIAKEVVLDGTGFSPVINSGLGTNAPILIVQPGMHLTLRNLTVSNGQLVGLNGTNGQSGQPARGAAMQIDHGFVTLDHCTFSANSVTAGNGSTSTSTSNGGGDGAQAAGGAIYNNGGQLLITNCTFSANSSVGGVGGAGASSAGVGNGTHSSQGGNGGLGTGAALYNVGNGIVAIYSSAFSSNSVAGSVGGLGGTPGTLGGFTGDNGTSGAGLGAAIYNESGSIAIVNSTFVGNTATGSAGGAGAAGNSFSKGTTGSAGGVAEGAGIFNASGQVTITNSTFVSNVAVGGSGGAGGSGQSALFGSDGAAGGAGGEAAGSGLFTADQGVTVVVNCTFTDNQVTGGSGGQGGAGTGVGDNGRTGGSGRQSGAAIYNSGGTIVVRNTILADSLGGSNAAGAITDAGFNLSSDATPALNGPGSRNQIDPLLGSYTSAGGASFTMTLATNSPAINAITDQNGNGAPAFDQRNAIRVYPFDVGAYEAGGNPLQPTLQAQRSTTGLVVSWASGNGFQLQTTTNVTNATTWSSVTTPPVVNNGSQTLTVPTSNSAAFYRLIRSQ